MYKNFKKIISQIATVIVGAVIFFRCAGQFAPPGGPPDTTPPTIIGSYPAANTLQFNDNEFKITFSEWMEKNSVDESVFLSPNLGDLEYSWSGTELSVKFSDTLRKNTTYVLTIGTDAKDLHAGNKMAKSFALPFSTGDHIDSGAISGTIYNEKPEGIMVFAYELDNRNGDTLNPAHCKPDYLTQTGKDGSFNLPYLRLGNYRILACRDEYKNLLYDPEIDQYGVPQHEYTITAEHRSVDHLTIQMTTADTAAPFLSSVKAVDRQHAIVRFSEPIDTSSFRVENITILDTVKNIPLSIIDASPSDTSLGEVLLLTGEQDSTKTYKVSVTGVRDLQGNAMVKNSTKLEFDGNGQADTTKPDLTILNLKMMTDEVFPADSLQLGLSEWVIRSKFENGFVVKDSAKNIIPGKLTWLSSIHAFFVPQLPWKYRMPYSVNVALDSLIDVAGNRFHDSTKVLKFQIIDPDKLGTVSGRVIDDQNSMNEHVVIEAIPLDQGLRHRTKILQSPGKFSFDNLQSGKYILYTFADADSNGIYSYGSVTPFVPSERFAYHPDTLKVRARWSLEDITVHLK